MKNDFSFQNGKKIAVQQRSIIYWCEIEKIVYLKCDCYLTSLILSSGEKITVSRLLKNFEVELENFGFVRANRSFLINMAHVKRFLGGTKRIVELTNGEVICVSRRNVFKFKDYLLFNQKCL
ncbi:MAG: LytTR family transcriptional regulator DNA-binding domain-containing protein [Salinivirgaceae bacterium]